MEKFKVTFCRAIGSVYVPHTIKKRKDEIILHISDTPYSFFGALKNLINKINPEYIIHTGDLVDNIKLEFCHYSLFRYVKNMKTLLNILENSCAKKIYISLGNHDQKEKVEESSERIEIIEKSGNIKIGNINLKISHYVEEIQKEPLEYNLFGHDLTIKNKIEDAKVYLNGIQSINIINVKTGEVTKLPYPFGLDEDRLRKGKVGL